MEAILSVLSSLFNWMVTSTSAVISVIVDNPLILMFVCLGFVGIGVGLIKRLIRM